MQERVPEKEASVDHIFGSERVLPETEKHIVQATIREAFDGKLFQESLPKERKKTTDEVRAIESADGVTNELAEQYGGRRLTIPAKSIHVIPQDQWDNTLPYDAYYNPFIQGVAMRECESMSFFIQHVIHEMIHCKSWAAFRVSEKERQFFPYRMGIEAMRVVKSSDSTQKTVKRFFAVVNEAMTEELAKRLFHKKNLRSLFPKEEQDTMALLLRNGPNDEVIAGRTVQKEDGKIHESWVGFGYQSERAVLHTVIDKLYEGNKDQFQNREEVFDFFARWMFSKSAGGLGKLVDQTFGAGTFHRLALLPLHDQAKQRAFLESLQ